MESFGVDLSTSVDTQRVNVESSGVDLSAASVDTQRVNVKSSGVLSSEDVDTRKRVNRIITEDCDIEPADNKDFTSRITFAPKKRALSESERLRLKFERISVQNRGNIRRRLFV